MKATGDGMSYPLDTLGATAAPGETLKLSRIIGAARKSRWSVGDVRPAEEFVGAFAVEEKIGEIQY